MGLFRPNQEKMKKKSIIFIAIGAIITLILAGIAVFYLVSTKVLWNQIADAIVRLAVSTLVLLLGIGFVALWFFTIYKQAKRSDWIWMIVTIGIVPIMTALLVFLIGKFNWSWWGLSILFVPIGIYWLVRAVKR